MITPDADLRLPEHRRETFLAFYEFHLRYRAHPGCVYYMLPRLSTPENRFWIAFVNGCTQNPVTTHLITREFPSIETLSPIKFITWWKKNYDRLEFDTDRRYHKKDFALCVRDYRERMKGTTEHQFFTNLINTPTPFTSAWRECSSWISFGRLSTFSYLEYLAIAGLPLRCDTLFLDDMSGSKSHRNGLAIVSGNDHLDWHQSNQNWCGYASGDLNFLGTVADSLLTEAETRFADQPFAGDVGNFTLESTLCTYKGWHRPNRRYPNVYNDLLFERIRKAETKWGQLPAMWRIREEEQPSRLLTEHTGCGGVTRAKQNFYRTTGHQLYLGVDRPEFGIWNP